VNTTTKKLLVPTFLKFLENYFLNNIKNQTLARLGKISVKEIALV